MANIYYLIGNRYRETTDYEKALNSYKLVIENYPTKAYFIEQYMNM